MKNNLQKLHKEDCPIFEHNVAITTSSSSLKIEEEWLDAEGAASYLKVTVGALRNMTWRGDIKAHKLGKRRVRYSIKDLREFLFKGDSHGNS